MTRLPPAVLLLVFLPPCVRGGSSASPVSTQQFDPPVKSITTIIKDGGRMDWSEKLDLIVFDRKGEDGFYDIWTMKPDGSEQVCLTSDTPGLPPKHVGQPAWHPSGEYIVFQAEKAVHPGGSIKARPGLGVENDLWVMTRDGEKAWQLTDLPYGTGVLHPHFSHDGKKLLWAEMIRPPRRGEMLGGEWAMRLADFLVDEHGARLDNVRTLQPRGPVFYETHGFSKDDSSIIFSGNLEPGQPVWTLDIYTMDLATGEVKNLTSSPDEWDEHAHYSPSFEKIAWISSKGSNCDPGNLRDLTTDLWLINADGSGKTRLTHFSEPGRPEYAGRRVIAGDSAWGPDGKRLVVRLIVDRGPLQLLNLQEEIEPIVMVEFTEAQ